MNKKKETDLFILFPKLMMFKWLVESSIRFIGKNNDGFKNEQNKK